MRHLVEYIWIDGTKPTPQLRSKTRVVEGHDSDALWGFDGSSTNQAPGEDSDCVLRPIRMIQDPFRPPGSLLALCEVLDARMRPHTTNKRHITREHAVSFGHHDCWFGLEQEYTLMKEGRPLGFPRIGYPAPQGQYYCSVGSANSFGREIVEEHLHLCMKSGLKISGVNAEVMPGQWEFQIGPLGPLEVGDQLWLARYILERVAEKHGVTVSWDPKPIKGDWNGAGCHSNFSTKQMREVQGVYLIAPIALQDAFTANPAEIQEVYGHDIKSRLTGDHETCSYKEFRWGVSDRGASIRIPWQVNVDQVGYIEDRRPNANCDPYRVTSYLMEKVCPVIQSLNEPTQLKMDFGEFGISAGKV